MKQIIYRYCKFIQKFIFFCTLENTKEGFVNWPVYPEGSFCYVFWIYSWKKPEKDWLFKIKQLPF